MVTRVVGLLLLLSTATAGAGCAAGGKGFEACADALAAAKSAAQPTRARKYREPWAPIRLARERCQALSTPADLRGEALLLSMKLPEYADGRTGIRELRAMVVELEGFANVGLVKPRLLEELAGRLAVSGQEAEAVDRLNEALASRKGAFGSESLEYREGLCVSSRIRAELAASEFDAENNSRMAEAEARDAVELSMARGGQDSPGSLDAWMNLADVLNRLGRLEEAQAIREEYLDKWMTTPGTAASPNP